MLISINLHRNTITAAHVTFIFRACYVQICPPRRIAINNNIIQRMIIKFNLYKRNLIASTNKYWFWSCPFQSASLGPSNRIFVCKYIPSWQPTLSAWTLVHVLDTDHVEINSFLVNRNCRASPQHQCYINACHKQANFCLFIPEIPSCTHTLRYISHHLSPIRYELDWTLSTLFSGWLWEMLTLWWTMR